MHDPETLATLFHRACERAGIRYVVVEGVAVSAWGQPRATADLDTLAILDPARVADLAAALREEGLGVDVRDLEDAARDGSHATVFDEASVFHIDVKPAMTDSEREQVEAGIVLDLSGRRLRVARAEASSSSRSISGHRRTAKTRAPSSTGSVGTWTPGVCGGWLRRWGSSKRSNG